MPCIAASRTPWPLPPRPSSVLLPPPSVDAGVDHFCGGYGGHAGARAVAHHVTHFTSRPLSFLVAAAVHACPLSLCLYWLLCSSVCTSFWLSSWPSFHPIAPTFPVLPSDHTVQQGDPPPERALLFMLCVPPENAGHCSCGCLSLSVGLFVLG